VLDEFHTSRISVHGVAVNVARAGSGRPVLLLWSRQGLGATYDVPAIWRDRATDCRGHAVDCGHFLAEEQPERTSRELLAFVH